MLSPMNSPNGINSLAHRGEGRRGEGVQGGGRREGGGMNKEEMSEWVRQDGR